MTATVDRIERLLCERYNVRSLDGLGALPGAIEAARGGDLGPLRAALEGRELYQWGPAIVAALRVDAEVSGAGEGSQEIPSLPDEPSPTPDAEPEPAAEPAAEPDAEPETESADSTKPTPRRRTAARAEE